MRQIRLYKFPAVLKSTIYKTTRASIEHSTYYIPHVIKTVATTRIYKTLVLYCRVSMHEHDPNKEKQKIVN